MDNGSGVGVLDKAALVLAALEAGPATLAGLVAGTGLAEVWAAAEAYAAATAENGYFGRRRGEQQQQWLHQSIRQALAARFYESAAVRAALPGLEAQVAAAEITPAAAAQALSPQLAALEAQWEVLHAVSGAADVEELLAMWQGALDTLYGTMQVGAMVRSQGINWREKRTLVGM